MMKKTAWAFGLAALMVSTSALSADITVPTHDWSGYYLGVNGGFGFGSNNWNHDSGLATDNGNFSGALGGVTAGVNWQTGKMVLGVEGDADIAGLKALDGSGAFNCVRPNCATYVNSLATLRGRVGYDVANGVMAYATGGLAGGYVHANIPGFLGDGDFGQATKLGWTAGIGIEAAVTQQVSVKAEAMYVDLGRLNNNLLPCVTNCYTDTRFALARVGLNFKF